MDYTIATEIIPNLWLGGIKTAQNKDWIEENIDIVINCTKDLAFISEKTENIRIPVDDNLEEVEIHKLYRCLPQINSVLDRELRKGKRILVHCFAGKQRSATVVCCFLMQFLDLDFNRVVQYIKTKRDVIFEPRCNFLSAIVKFGSKLQSNRDCMSDL